MIGQTLTCGRDGCNNTFVKTAHNSKYCNVNNDNACLKLQTNTNIMKNYYEQVAIRKGLKRTCEVCDTAQLSRYNKTRVCASCEIAKARSRKVTININVLIPA